MRLLIATTNSNKVREIRPVLAASDLELITLADLSPIAEAPESALTYWENARMKALHYARESGRTAVAEDSGLEIAVLDGEPGVHSARFLGPQVPYPDRFTEIYRRLAASEAASRDARFITALTLARPDGTILFETEAAIEGVIATAPAGAHGFGYDPIFFYSPLGKTTAEMTLDDKCAVSHRARAFRDLARWLRATSA